MKKTSSARKSGKKKRAPLYLLIVAFLLIGASLILLRLSGVGSPKGSEPINEMVDSTELMQYAKSVKQDLKDVFSHIRDEDVTELEKSVDRLDGDVGGLKTFLSAPVWSMSEKLPTIGREITTARELIDVAELLSSDLLRPWIALQRSFERPEGSEEEPVGRSVKLQAKLAFLSEKLPLIKSLIERVESRDLSLIDGDGKLAGYLAAAKPLINIADKYSGDLLDPLVALMDEHPLSELKTEEGYDFEEIGVYSSFLSDKLPAMKNMLAEINAVDMSAIDSDGKIKGYLELGNQLLPVLETANGELLQPGLRLLSDYPVDSIKADNGFNAHAMLAYLNYLEEKMPQIESLIDTLDTLDLSKLDAEERVGAIREKLIKLRDLYHENETYFAAAKVILGDGGDRFYLLVAQNGAEVRASGGFPGDVGTIEIRDGILTINEFASVYTVFKQQTSYLAKITKQEQTMFTNRMYTTWDADFCPDFERVAQIWAYAYKDRRGTMPDGIISATPVIVQKLLQVAEASVTLSNDMVLDGESATRILQHDIYFEYKRDGMIVYSDVDMTDILFAESVKLTLEAVTSNLSVSNLTDYIEKSKECIEERILLFWMADPDEEEIIRQAGWSGGMSKDPNDPKLGIFFSGEQSGKMGYFLDMIPEIGEPVVNEDGSRTYPVVLTLSNVITKEEQRIGGTWILGRSYTGSIVGDLLLTAPVGGEITDIYTGLARSMWQSVYQDLDSHFIHWLIIERGNPLVIRFKVTTAPGVDAPLGILATPTLTQYR